MLKKTIQHIALSALFCTGLSVQAAAVLPGTPPVLTRSEVQKPISSSLARTVIRINSLGAIKDPASELLFLTHHLLESLLRADYSVAFDDLKAAVQKLHRVCVAQDKSLHDLIVRSAHSHFLYYVQDYAAAQDSHDMATGTLFEQEFWDQNFYYGEAGSAHRKNIPYYRCVTDSKICFCRTYDYQKREIILEPHPESSVELCKTYIQLFAGKIALHKGLHGAALELR